MNTADILNRGRAVQAMFFLGFLAGQGAAQAVTVPVANSSFEAPAIAAGTFQTTAAPPSWSVYGSGINFGLRTIGVLDPNGTTLYPGPVPDGENVGVVFLLDDAGDQTAFAGIEAGMEQTLSAPLETNTRYDLTVEVGNIADDVNPPNNQFQFAGFPGYRIDLLAGGTPIACDANTLLPSEGSFVTSTLQVTIGNTHAQAGQMLGIRVVNLNAAPGLEVNFDDVSLQALPIQVVPAMGIVPTSLLGLILALLGVFVLSRRKLARR